MNNYKQYNKIASMAKSFGRIGAKQKKTPESMPYRKINILILFTSELMISGFMID